MGGEKDILKFDGDRTKYETQNMQIYAHSFKGKFDDVFVNQKHPKLPVDGACTPKETNKLKAKRIKRFLKKNNRAVADVQIAVASNWTLITMINKTCTEDEPRNIFDVKNKEKWIHKRKYLESIDYL